MSLLISTFNKKRYDKEGVLAEKFHFTLCASINTDSLECKSWCKNMLQDKCFYTALNNLTTFFKGWRNDKTLKASFHVFWTQSNI